MHSLGGGWTFASPGILEACPRDRGPCRAGGNSGSGPDSKAWTRVLIHKQQLGAHFAVRLVFAKDPSKPYAFPIFHFARLE